MTECEEVARSMLKAYERWLNGGRSTVAKAWEFVFLQLPDEGAVLRENVAEALHASTTWTFQ